MVDGHLYVRAYNGTASRWYQAALKQKAGQITAAGVTKDVAFAPAPGQLQDAIDAAYRAKYASSPYLRPMTGDEARAATMHITPRAYRATHNGTKRGTMQNPENGTRDKVIARSLSFRY